MSSVIKYDLAMPVSVRKYEVDIEKLRQLLRSAKSEIKLTNRQIAEYFERPITEVEHWFRTDTCFSIPDPEIWHGLKSLLGIITDEFDIPITTFEEKDGVFEKANRFYDIDGIAPTITVASADEKIIVDHDFISTYKPKGDVKLTNLKPFKYVELFAGIGGFRQALDKLGGECVLASEIDKYASQAYRVLYGGAEELHGDVTKIAAEDVPDHEVLVGGFPCQAFSVAGKRLGFEDTRGTLFFEIARIAKVKRPKVMLMENVKGLVGHDGGKTLDVIVQTLNDIGYTVDFEVLNSKYFGVPQNRERIFIVAIRDDLVTPSPWVIGKRTDVVAKGKRRIAELEGVKTFNFDYPSQDSVSIRLRDILESVVDERFYYDEVRAGKLIKQLKENGFEDNSTDGCNLVGRLEMKGHDCIKRIYDTEFLCPTLTTMGGGNTEPKIAEKNEEIRIRKLTPRECFRLQGFSDEDFDKLAANGISNSQLYKMAGNAVTVNVIDAIGKRLLPYLD